MAESQNIEWKESWRDEYLKWICGFANAQGGKIYIGCNDDGEIVGVEDSKKLMEDIPNKITQSLGIVADVNLLEKDDKEYIEKLKDKTNYRIYDEKSCTMEGIKLQGYDKSEIEALADSQSNYDVTNSDEKNL